MQPPPIELQSQSDSQTRRREAGGFGVKVDVELVLLNVGVRDRATNRGIPGLKRHDFAVYEDGVEQNVEYFTGGEAPFDALLLLDISGSTQRFLPLMKRAAVRFVDSLKSDDRVALASFNSFVELLQEFTSDRRDIVRAIDSLTSSGGTALYDALLVCLEEVVDPRHGRSAVVVFTDGLDNQLEGPNSEGSRAPFSMLLRRVRETGSLIYAIFLDTQEPAKKPRRGIFWQNPRIPWPIPSPRAGGPPRPEPHELNTEAQAQLRTVVEQTGGRMFSLTRVEELSGAFTQIAADMRIQYQLGYVSRNLNRDGRWREIRVQLRNHPEAAASARRGYYAPRSAGAPPPP
jgi:VWFA-related protein